MHPGTKAQQENKGFMQTLFGDDVTAPTAPEIAELVRFGYREDLVKGWTRERAQTVLAKRRREEATGARRASSVALQQGEDGPARGASLLEREIAARYLEQSLKGNADDLLIAISATVYVLSDDELRAEGERLLGVYLTQS